MIRYVLSAYLQGPVELHLRLRAYMRPPDILLEVEEAIPCDSDASQYLCLTSSSLVLLYYLYCSYSQSVEAFLEEDEQFADQLKEYYAFGDALR